METAYVGIPLLYLGKALPDFLLHMAATRARKTVLYYKVQLGGLAAWCVAEGILFDIFGKRHLDRYLVSRSQAGKSQWTLHHDAVCAKAFFAWCQKNDLLSAGKRSPLAEYQVRNAPVAPKHMPSDAEMVALLKAAREYWNPWDNPNVRGYGSDRVSIEVKSVHGCPFCQDVESVVVFSLNRSGTQRYRCKACGKTFTPNGRTRQLSSEKIRSIEGALAERISQRGIARALGVSRNTIRAVRQKGQNA